MVIDRMRRGTHDRADATGPCSADRRQLPSSLPHESQGMPSPSLLCTLHIGGANLTSRATCDSPVLPRSPTDVPSPCGQRRRRIYPDNSYRLQADAIRGCNLARTAVITMATHAHATGGGFPDARLLLPARRVHLVCIAQGRCSWHARMLTQIGRQRPL